MSSIAMRCDPTCAPLTPALGPSANKGINPIGLRDLILTSRRNRRLEGWDARRGLAAIRRDVRILRQAIKSQQNQWIADVLVTDSDRC